MASRPSELFAISAALLLGFSFLSRLASSRAGISIALHSVGYVFPPSTVFLVMASFFCFFATIYATWPPHMNPKAGAWHYWIAAVGITAFWVCFYLCAFNFVPVSNLGPYSTAAFFGQFISVAV